MDLGGWLRSLDLEEYEAAFHKNHIDEVVLPNLTAEDLGASASDRLGTVVSCSTPSRCYAVMRKRKRKHRRLKLLRSLSPLKTPPSAVR